MGPLYILIALFLLHFAFCWAVALLEDGFYWLLERLERMGVDW